MPLTHDDLIRLGTKWLATAHNNWKLSPPQHQFGCGVVLTEFCSSCSRATPDVIGFSHHNSVVIECKVSRSDFLADSKKTHRHQSKQLGNLRYYLTLPEVATADDVDDWGLLHVHGKIIKIIKYPVYHTEPEIKVAEYALLYSLALRVSRHGLLPTALSKY